MLKSLKSKVIAAGGAVVGVVTAVTPVLAEGAAGTADAAVTGAFEGISNNVVATMGAVAPYALAILAIFLGFRYGKRIFTALSSNKG